MKTWWIKKAVAFTALAAVMIFAMGGVVMLLWNAIVPEVFGITTLSYWQSVGLLLLTQILFRGIGHWRSRHSYEGHVRWKHKLEEKLAAMSPEEREKFKAEWKRRCECGPEQGEHG